MFMGDCSFFSFFWLTTASDMAFLSLLGMHLRPGLQWTGHTLMPAFPSQEGKPNTGSFAEEL
jgi:hypothetical protein